jgi:hypothetical protein
MGIQLQVDVAVWTIKRVQKCPYGLRLNAQEGQLDGVIQGRITTNRSVAECQGPRNSFCMIRMQGLPHPIQVIDHGMVQIERGVNHARVKVRVGSRQCLVATRVDSWEPDALRLDFILEAGNVAGCFANRGVVQGLFCVDLRSEPAAQVARYAVRVVAEFVCNADPNEAVLRRRYRAEVGGLAVRLALVRINGGEVVRTWRKDHWRCSRLHCLKECTDHQYQLNHCAARRDHSSPCWCPNHQRLGIFGGRPGTQTNSSTMTSQMWDGKARIGSVPGDNQCSRTRCARLSRTTKCSVYAKSRNFPASWLSNVKDVVKLAD